MEKKGTCMVPGEDVVMIQKAVKWEAIPESRIAEEFCLRVIQVTMLPLQSDHSKKWFKTFLKD